MFPSTTLVRRSSVVDVQRGLSSASKRVSDLHVGSTGVLKDFLSPYLVGFGYEDIDLVSPESGLPPRPAVCLVGRETWGETRTTRGDRGILFRRMDPCRGGPKTDPRVGPVLRTLSFPPFA